MNEYSFTEFSENTKWRVTAVMKENGGVIYHDVQKCIDEIIQQVGKEITFCIPLALGKPMVLANALYRRAKEDPEIKLRIITALPLEKPRGHSELEKRFLGPLSDRIFAGVPDLEYMLDFREGRLPKNVEFLEFYSKAGSNLNYPEAQQNHIASNYTHVYRDAENLGANVLAQMVSCREIDGRKMYSMSCNPDVYLEAVRGFKRMRAEGKKVALIAEVNEKLPFMYGDAVVEAETYDIILEGPQFNYELFCPPKILSLYPIT